MEDQIYTMILQARDEMSAQLAEVSASMQRMTTDIGRQTIIAGQSFNELNRQTQLMAQGMDESVMQTRLAEASFGTLNTVLAETDMQVRLAEASYAELRTQTSELTQQTRLLEAGFAGAGASAAATATATASAGAAAATHAAAMSNLGVAVRDVSSSFGAVQQDITHFQSAMMDAAIVALPIAIVGGDFLKQAGDYEAAINKIRGLSSATPEDIGLWGPAMVEMSQQGTKSAQEYANAMFFVASSQLHGADALHVLDQAAKASTGGLGDMNVIAQALVGTLNAYVPQAERASQATSFMDKITEAVVQGHMDPAALAPQLGRVTPIAAAAGVPIEDVLAAVATTTHIGGTVDQGVTGLRAILTTLMAPGVGSQKALAEMGIDPATIGKRLREEGLQQTLAEIDAASLAQAGGDKDAQDAILKHLFPQARTALPTLLALTRTGGDIDTGGGDANFFKQIDTSIATSSAGVTDRANTTALEGMNAQMAVLKNNVDAVGIAFGEALIPKITPLIQQLIPALVQNMTQFANDAIRAGTAAVGVAQGIGTFTAALASLAGMADVTITPLQLIEGALLVFGAIALVSAGQAVIGFIGDLSGLYLALARVGAEAVIVASEFVVAWIAGLGPIGLIVGAVILVLGGLALAWANDWGNIREITASAVQFIGDHWQLLASFFLPMLQLPLLLQAAWSNDFLGIQEIVGNAVGFITSHLSDLMDWLAAHHLGVPSDWRDQWGDAKQAITDAASGIQAGVGGAANALSGGLAGAAATVQAAKDQIGGGMASAGDAVQSTRDQISRALAQIQAGFGALQGPNTLSIDAKAAIDKAMADINAAQATLPAVAGPAVTAPSVSPAAAEKTALERELLDLKRQQLEVEGQMLIPQQHLADLQAQMKEAAQDQIRLADEQRLLALDQADFAQNADLKRINFKIAQEQDALKFEQNPVQAGALENAIRTQEQQAFAIRQSMIPDNNARLEAGIAQSQDQLNVKIDQNAISQQIADVNAALTPLEATKKQIADATALVQHQQSIDALQQKVEPVGAGSLPITPRTPPEPTAGPEGTPGAAGADGTVYHQHTSAPPVGGPTAEQPPVSIVAAGGAPVTYHQHTYHIALNNPVLTTEQNQDDVLIFLRAGLEAADAQGVPLAGTGTDIH